MPNKEECTLYKNGNCGFINVMHTAAENGNVFFEDGQDCGKTGHCGRKDPKNLVVEADSTKLTEEENRIFIASRTNGKP